MNKLLKEYGFNNDMQYYEMIAESFNNGQRKQAIDQFKALPKTGKISLIKVLCARSWAGIGTQDTQTLIENI